MKTKSIIGASKSEFKTEAKEKLKLKRAIRKFREKTFYADHSKFATKMDKDYLETFGTYIVTNCKKFIRQQDINMSSEVQKGLETHSNTRILHSCDVAKLSRSAARELLLNEDLAEDGGLLHDLGHFAYAHFGEVMFSNYLKYYGIAELHHPVIARYILEKERIHERVLERLEKRKGRPFTKSELKKYNRYKMILIDAAAAHNGEGLDTEVVCKMDKTEQEIEEEYINAFTTPGADRTIVAKTPEAAIIRFMDPISYVAKDFRDGVIAKVISVHDPDFEAIFRKMGVPEEILNSKANKKDEIVRAVTDILRDDLIANSEGINGARMSKKMAELMYQLRSLCYNKAGKPKATKLLEILPGKTKQLLDRYTEHLMTYKSYKDAPEGTYLRGFLKSVKEKEPSALSELNREVVKKGIEEFVRREVESVLAGESDNTTIRRRRIQNDLERLQKMGKITNEIKERYIQLVLKEINLSPKDSQKYFLTYLKRINPGKSDEEIEQMAKENPELRFETFDECLARFRTTMQIGTASNTYLLEVLSEENLLSEEELATRYVRGGHDSSYAETERIQAEEAKKRASKGEAR